MKLKELDKDVTPYKCITRLGKKISINNAAKTYFYRIVVFINFQNDLNISNRQIHN